MTDDFLFSCSRDELIAWVKPDRRMPGQVLAASSPACIAAARWAASSLPKNVNARAWLPTTVEAARIRIGEWRSQDATAKSYLRRGLRSVG